MEMIWRQWQEPSWRKYVKALLGISVFLFVSVHGFLLPIGFGRYVGIFIAPIVFLFCVILTVNAYPNYRGGEAGIFARWVFTSAFICSTLLLAVFMNFLSTNGNYSNYYGRCSKIQVAHEAPNSKSNGHLFFASWRSHRLHENSLTLNSHPNRQPIPINLSPDGKWILSASYEAMKVVDYSSGKTVSSFKLASDEEKCIQSLWLKQGFVAVLSNYIQWPHRLIFLPINGTKTQVLINKAASINLVRAKKEGNGFYALTFDSDTDKRKRLELYEYADPFWKFYLADFELGERKSSVNDYRIYDKLLIDEQCPRRLRDKEALKHLIYEDGKCVMLPVDLQRCRLYPNPDLSAAVAHYKNHPDKEGYEVVTLPNGKILHKITQPCSDFAWNPSGTLVAFKQTFKKVPTILTLEGKIIKTKKLSSQAQDFWEFYEYEDEHMLKTTSIAFLDDSQILVHSYGKPIQYYSLKTHIFKAFPIWTSKSKSWLGNR